MIRSFGMLAYGAFKRPPGSADTVKKVMATSQLQGWLMGKSKVCNHASVFCLKDADIIRRQMSCRYR